MDAIERIWRRLQYISRRAALTLVDDSKGVQFAQATLPGPEVFDGVPRLAEYGFQSVPPAGSDAVVVYLAGNPADGVVIATGSRQYRLTGLAAGECAISDDKGQKVYLSADGIRIEGGSLPMQINASAGLTVNADTVFNGTVTANGHRIDETHKHSGVQAGGSNTGVVT